MSATNKQLYEVVTPHEFPTGLLCERCFGQIHNGHAFVSLIRNIEISPGGSIMAYQYVVGFCCLERDPAELGLVVKRSLRSLRFIPGLIMTRVCDAIIGRSSYGESVS